MTSISPRKSPRQQRSRETVAVLLEAAAQILEAQGLAGFNTNAVAARAGVSVGSIYQYFPDKAALMAALIRRESARFELTFGQALAQADGFDLRAALEALVAAAVAHQTARPNLAQILDLEERRLGLENESAALSQTTLSRLEHVLGTRGVAEARIAARDLLNMARGMIDGALADAPEDLTRRIVKAAMGYLA